MIRWICEKDNKKWLYPVKNCIYCKGPVKKQISTKLKVIGLTKVNIPSPMHPIIPYNVILLEDEFGNRIPKKTMKNYIIGDDYAVEKAKTDDAVVITKVKYDLGEALKESLKLLNVLEIKEDDRILIKPSIIEPAYAYQAVTTNPDLIEAFLSYLKENGVKDVIIAEQAMIGNDTLDSARKSGILGLCEKHKIPFLDLSKAGYVEKDGFRVAKEVVERKVVNIPVMKTNSQLGISGAIENLIRATSEETQKSMFKEDIEKILPKLVKVLPCFLNIGDATIGLHGQGPTIQGEPAFLNTIFASKDPVALDNVFVEFGMFAQPHYLENKHVEIVNNEIEAVKFHLKRPDKSSSPHPNIKLVDGKANPYDFNSSLKMCTKLFGLAGHEINLVIGNILTKEMLQNKKRLVVYGNEAIQKVRGLGIEVLAEIADDLDDIEKIMLLKSLLQNAEKKKLTAADKLKSKMAKFGAKVKRVL
jgi:uncharacterized protein (DUF362 family)